MAAVAEDAFYTITNTFLDGAVYGVPTDPAKTPRFLQSVGGLGQKLMLKCNGDQMCAAAHVTKTFRGWRNEVRQFFTSSARAFLSVIFPPLALLAFPVAMFRKIWVTLRKVCLLAYLYGYDMDDQATRNKILVLAVGLPIPLLGMETTRAVIKQIYSIVLTPLGPVGAIVGLPVRYVTKKLFQKMENKGFALAARKMFPDVKNVTGWDLEKDKEPRWRQLDRFFGSPITGQPIEGR